MLAAPLEAEVSTFLGRGWYFKNGVLQRREFH